MLLKTLSHFDNAINHKAQHLKKFQDIDAFFGETQDIIRDYFQTQAEFQDYERFQEFLKEQITYYAVCFGRMDTVSYDNYGCIEEIAKKYSKLVFYKETNPYQTQIQQSTLDAVSRII